MTAAWTFYSLTLLPLMATRLQNMHGITAHPHRQGAYTKKETSIPGEKKKREALGRRVGKIIGHIGRGKIRGHPRKGVRAQRRDGEKNLPIWK